MTVTDAPSRLSEAVDSARVSHEPVFLLRRGRRVAALVDAEDLATLIEDVEDPDVRRRIQAAIELLAETPRPPGAKILSGSSGDWRVRTGDYRTIYEIRDAELIVLVVAMGHRRDIHLH